MPRKPLSSFVRLLSIPSPALLFVLAAAGCGGKTLLETGEGGDAGSGGSGGGTTGTDPPCACATDADCPQGLVCEACACVPECDDGFADCDGIAANGCESPAGACLCSPGEVQSCYGGPPGTEGVGVCKAGLAQCAGGTAWGPCEGQILPGEEVCDGVDGDCDGHDDAWDPDGDGWTACDGDCCETADCWPQPEQVNPGALDYPNGFDDDCNPGSTDGLPTEDCSGPALQTPTSSMKLFRAMGLCQVTVESPASPKEKTWGVISGALTLADGTSALQPKDVQAGVLASYGQVAPVHGSTMGALSSGTARAEGDPGYVHPQNGYSGGQIGNFVASTAAPIPPDFLAANGGAVPGACFTCAEPGCATAFDSILLKLRIRTPTNAEALRFRANFYTAEYPESVCTKYNDFFVALLDSQHPDTPIDKNIAYSIPGEWLSVNSAVFRSCAYPTCADGPDGLVGTGMGGWDGTLVDGGGTGWVDIDAPIVPGETIELRLAIWDAIEGNIDSLVLIDDMGFRKIGEGPPPGP